MSAARHELQVVTVATQPGDPSGKGGNLRLLESTCRACGLELTVLGMGRAWRGSGTKALLLKEYVEKVPSDAPILSVDAYDVLVLGDRDRILARFARLGAPLVFCAEIACWPRPDLASRYPGPGAHRGREFDARILRLRPPPPCDLPFRYLNAGACMGYAGAIREALRDVAPRAEDSDQEAWTLYFLEHPNRLALDYEGRLFQSLYGVSPREISIEPGSPPEVRCLRTGWNPYVLHGNGSGMETFREIVRRLEAMGWPGAGIRLS